MSATNSQRSFLVFTVCSSSVIASYGKYENGKSTVLFEDSIFFRTTRVNSIEGYMQEAVKIIDILAEKVCINISKLAGPIPDKINCVYTSPWIDTILTEYEKEFDSDRVFDDKIKAILANEFKSISDSYANDQVAVCSSRTTSIRLNGYAVTSPEGKRFKKISATNIIDVIDLSIKDAVEASLSKHFSHRMYLHSSFSSALQFHIQHNAQAFTGDVFLNGIESREIVRIKKGELTEVFSIAASEDLEGFLQTNTLIFDEKKCEMAHNQPTISTVSIMYSLR